VRIQNLWERGIIKSYGAIINLQFFGYSKFYLIRVEVSDYSAVELKQRLSLNRYIIIFIEIDGSVDLVKRIYIAICQTKNLKAAKEEVHNLTEGIKEIRAVTFNLINYAEQKAIRLEDTDLIK
jgi:DNA-binding Lrp family transcriptional regulator